MAKKRDNNPFLLRKHGLKATTSRLRALEIFQKSRYPLSAQQVIEYVPTVADQATIYRIIDTFKKKGLIKQIDLRHNHAHYELVKGIEHHHLICVECGRIEDVHHCGVGDSHTLVLKHARHFAHIHEHVLEFYGICKTCVKKGEMHYAR